MEGNGKKTVFDEAHGGNNKKRPFSGYMHQKNVPILNKHYSFNLFDKSQKSERNVEKSNEMKNLNFSSK